MVNFVSKHNRNIVSCTKLQDPEVEYISKIFQGKECECVKVVGMRESNGQNHRRPKQQNELDLVRLAL